MSREMIIKCSKCGKSIPEETQFFIIKKVLAQFKDCVIEPIKEKVVEDLCSECGIDYGEPETQYGNRENSKR